MTILSMTTREGTMIGVIALIILGSITLAYMNRKRPTLDTETFPSEEEKEKRLTRESNGAE